MSTPWKLIILFLGAIVVVVPAKYGRYFSASNLCLALVVAASVFTFILVRRRAIEKQTVFYTATSPSTLAIIAAILVALTSYNLAALVNIAFGRSSVQDATVSVVVHARRCSTLANASVSSGKNVTYCAGYQVSPGDHVRLRLISSPLGVHAARG